MALARELSFRLPLQRGDDVRAVQQALIRAGMLTGSADGIFGPATHRAVLDFQRRMQARHPGFAADGIIGGQSWSALFPDAAPHPMPGAATPEAGLTASADWRALLRPYRQRLMAGSAPPVGQGSRRWRLSAEGVGVEGFVAPPRSPGKPETATRCWRDFRAAFETCAAAYGVPVELLIATACTESGGRAGAIREEPGFISDAATPHRVSPGLMQTLIATAREVLADNSLDRARLLDPATSIRAGAAMIRAQAMRRKLPTHFDPPLVAIAYNAGSLRARADGAADPWGMVQTMRGAQAHAAAFIGFFNDCFAVFADGDAPAALTPSFWALLAE
ncbi:MAG: transglycosylase SLT domain-containing protein [Roseomonas sp.]|nr:transglycosylase SLT domain-containing protein [Roseomonas sp.]